MLKNKKMIIYGLLVLNMVILSIFLIVLHLYEYLILSGVLLGVLVFLLVKEFNRDSQTDESKYEGQVNRLIKTYNPILVNTNTFPNLSGKSVMPVAQFDDLVNAQAEVRKPIYYVKGKDSTAFYLLNDEMFLIYYVKVNGNEKSELELEVDKMESSDVVTVETPTETIEKPVEEEPTEEKVSVDEETTKVEETKNEVLPEVESSDLETSQEESTDDGEDLVLDHTIEDDVLSPIEEEKSLDESSTSDEVTKEQETSENPEDEPQIVSNI